MSITEGDHVPPFEVASDGGGRFGARDLEGRVSVLYFYPKDDTPGCTKEAQAFRDLLPEFTAIGAKVIGVSTDGVASHDKFKAKHGLTFPLLADADKELAQAFGVWVEKSMYGKTYMGMERATFLIDATGVVRRVWRKVKVAGHAEAVLAAARALAA